ncbi:MAG TPA: DNA-binding protein [Elusimicrobiales bacterium]|nr:DNA-binding protein [Elusimicrobiales bacterium]
MMVQAQEKPYLTGRSFLFSIGKGEDLLQAVQQFCHHHQVRCGLITAIGAVDRATFGIYDQKAKKYLKINMEKEMEILSLSGNVSVFDDKPMVHAHIMFSDLEGKAYGGHLMAGTRVYSLEVFVQELTGEPKVRKLEKVTQLPLWGNPLSLK